MISGKKSSYFVIGLALFSMFFGSGNLIFPLYIGQLANENLIGAIFGFLSTAVLLPFLGVVAMVTYKGDYEKFFSVLGKWCGPLMIATLLTVWIPLGSGPRCTTLAYASLLPYFSMPPVWIFSLVYSVLVGLVVWKRSRIIDILGYVLTPLLLLCLGIIFFEGASFSGEGAVDTEHYNMFFKGLIEGYNTMDLIASFFFTSSIYGLLKEASNDGSNPLTTTFKSSIVGIVLLAIVYIGLISVAAFHASTLVGVPKDQLLAQISKSVMGAKWGIISAVSICLACFTTSIALTVVYAEFLEKTLLKKFANTHVPYCVTLIISFVMSLFGLSGITYVTSPLLQIFYPTLIILIVWNVGGKFIKSYLKSSEVESIDKVSLSKSKIDS